MQEGDRISIVIADDHPIMRDGLKRVLGSQPGIVIAGEATTGAEAIKVARELNPDVLLLDLNMPNLNGLEALEQISGSSIKAILLTVEIEKPQIVRALQLGVKGIVLKSATTDFLVKAIRHVANGQYWVDREMLALWAQSQQASSGALALTPREKEIVHSILAGHTNRQIASALSISEETVKRHLSNIYTKLGVANRLELALYAMQHHLDA